MELLKQSQLHATQCIVEIKVDEVYLPAVLGNKAALRATTHGKSKTTPLVKAAKGKNTTDAVAMAFQEMVKRCDERGFTMNEIETITEKSKEEIQETLDPDSMKTASPSSKRDTREALEQTVYKLELEYVLRFVVPTTYVRSPNAHVKLALVGEKKESIGEIVVDLKDVLRGSHPPRRADGGCDAIVFCANDGRKINAEVVVSIQGLSKVEGDNPEPETLASLAEAEGERARGLFFNLMKCFRGVCAKL
jgi:hypothetical protein